MRKYCFSFLLSPSPLLTQNFFLNMLEIAFNTKKTWSEKKTNLNIFFFFNISNNIPSISKTIQHTPWHGAHTYKVSRKYSNAFLSYSAKTKRDGQTDRWMDRQTGGVSISPGPSAWHKIQILLYCNIPRHGMNLDKIQNIPIRNSRLQWINIIILSQMTATEKKLKSQTAILDTHCTYFDLRLCFAIPSSMISCVFCSFKCGNTSWWIRIWAPSVGLGIFCAYGWAFGHSCKQIKHFIAEI